MCLNMNSDDVDDADDVDDDDGDDGGDDGDGDCDGEDDWWWFMISTFLCFGWWTSPLRMLHHEKDDCDITIFQGPKIG